MPAMLYDPEKFARNGRAGRKAALRALQELRFDAQNLFRVELPRDAKSATVQALREVVGGKLPTLYAVEAGALYLKIQGK